jgi:ribonuclease HII
MISILQSNYSGFQFEAGCDEAGRGCLAGPVYAAAVILPGDFDDPLLDDSKKLSEKHRNILRPRIEQNAIAWAVASVDNLEIDKINILNASILAMHKAIAFLTIRPQFLLVDGNRFKSYEDIPHACLVKGDGRFKCIAAASILAKTHRDDYMRSIHTIYPKYMWHLNKGYPTEKHVVTLSIEGSTPFHRKSFKPVKQLKIEFFYGG